MTTNNPIFSAEDLQQLAARGVSVETALEQLALIHRGGGGVRLLRPCTVGDGIRRIDDPAGELMAEGEAAAAAGRVTKFVPASGAATRMFKDLIAALESPDQRPSRDPRVRELFERLDDFPFADELKQRSGSTAPHGSSDDERRLLETLLYDLGYASRPKGLIPFHRCDSGVRTPFEEHLYEAAAFARAADGTCRVHFTVSPEAMDDFRSAGERLAALLAPGGSILDISFSVQHPATDTLAADESGAPFRAQDGTLLFRPGGHGALLRNLEHLQGDIVAVKNIDNVLPERNQHEVVVWKKVLIGLLSRVQRDIHTIVSTCADDSATEERIELGLAFAASTFQRIPQRTLITHEEKRRFVIEALDRPLRVCGVVKNEGEPGGAPFWTAGPDGGESVQIVESSQVDFGDAGQRSIWNASTHFNPVDIICGLRDWAGRPFELSKFVDPDAVFVAKKSHEGRDLFALELPGLWNGAMAFWNTICVEVPASTFAPVKTVFDLLRPQHQG